MSRIVLLPLCLCFGLAVIGAGQGPSKGAGLRTISLEQPKIALSAALAELLKQSGVRVADETGRPDQVLALALKDVTFWEALDGIARAAGARVSLGNGDRPIALVPAGAAGRSVPSSYSGHFRVRLSEITATRNFETGPVLKLTLEVAWAPTLKPLFLDTQVRAVRAVGGDGKALQPTDDGGALAPVDGRNSTTLELSLPGVPRAMQELASVEGKLLVVAPSKMLTFRFDADLKALQTALPGGALRRLAQEDVTCQIAKVVAEKERWSVQVALDYPRGGRTLESFQAGSLVANNELALVSRDGKRRLARTSYVIDAVSSRRALVTYHFRDAPGRRLGALGDWRPVYTAPAKIVDVEVPFAFKKVPLP